MSSVSDDDDSGPSLKELVTKNLEANGILGKLQAQLRASVFLILEEEFQEKNISLINEKTEQLLTSPVGKLAVTIIQDFLQCLSLEFTLAVFCPETKSTLTENSLNRKYLHEELGNNVNNIEDNYPFLFRLLEGLQTKKLDNITAKNPPIDERKTERNISKQSDNIKQDNRDSETSTTGNSKYVNVIKHKDLENKISESVNILKNNEYSESRNKQSNSTSTSSSVASSKLSSSAPNNDVENESSNHSTLTSSLISENNTLSAIEKEYEEEFSSSEANDVSQEEASVKDNISDKKTRETTESKSGDKTSDEKSEIEEAVETAEDVEEDILSMDDLLCSNSEMSNQTKDFTASKENSIVDYEETL